MLEAYSKDIRRWKLIGLIHAVQCITHDSMLKISKDDED